MKILHYQHCGVGVILTQALRKIGVSSSVLATSHPFGFKEDFLLQQSKLKRYFAWRRYAHSFDLLHSHHGGRLSDSTINLWKHRFIQHYHDPQIKQPYYGREVPAFVSLPNILKTIPHATWIPLPVESELFYPTTRHQNSPIRVGYCDQAIDPNKVKFVPQTEIKDAVRNLNGKAIEVPLTKVIPHSEMTKYYSDIDIWVDRIGLGFYGFASCEAASMGIPIITQIDNEIWHYVTDCPFVNVKTKANVTKEIKNLVLDENLRLELGRKSRTFAVDTHDYIKVAKLCLNKYKELIQAE